MDEMQKAIEQPGPLGAGKGDCPRNISEAFRRNYDGINWGPKGPNRFARKPRRVSGVRILVK